MQSPVSNTGVYDMNGCQFVGRCGDRDKGLTRLWVAGADPTNAGDENRPSIMALSTCDREIGQV